MPTEKAPLDIKKAMAYDLLKILKKCSYKNTLAKKQQGDFCMNT